MAGALLTSLRFPRLRRCFFGCGSLEGGCKAVAALQLLLMVFSIAVDGYYGEDIHESKLANDFPLSNTQWSSLREKYSAIYSYTNCSVYGKYLKVCSRHFKQSDYAFAVYFMEYMKLAVPLNMIMTTTCLFVGIRKREGAWTEPFLVAKGAEILDGLLSLIFETVARILHHKSIYIFIHLIHIVIYSYMFTIVHSYHEELHEEKAANQRIRTNASDSEER